MFCKLTVNTRTSSTHFCFACYAKDVTPVLNVPALLVQIFNFHFLVSNRYNKTKFKIRQAATRAAKHSSALAHSLANAISQTSTSSHFPSWMPAVWHHPPTCDHLLWQKHLQGIYLFLSSIIKKKNIYTYTYIGPLILRYKQLNYKENHPTTWRSSSQQELSSPEVPRGMWRSSCRATAQPALWGCCWEPARTAQQLQHLLQMCNRASPAATELSGREEPVPRARRGDTRPSAAAPSEHLRGAGLQNQLNCALAFPSQCHWATAAQQPFPLCEDHVVSNHVTHSWHSGVPANSRKIPNNSCNWTAWP